MSYEGSLESVYDAQHWSRFLYVTRHETFTAVLVAPSSQPTATEYSQYREP